MKKLLTAMTVAVAVTLGGCHVYRQHPVAQSAPVAQSHVATISELDARLTAVEHRLDVAKAYREKVAKARAQMAKQVKNQF